jgi:uncharacterized protein YkwD
MYAGSFLNLFCLPRATIMLLRLLSCLSLLALSSDLAAGDLYVAINRLRAGEGVCAAAATRMPALKPQDALERVAAELARAKTLQQGLTAAGYRATRSSALNISGDGVGAQAAEMLARPGYCRQLQDAALTEVGIYLDARQLWIVMAAPFAPSVASSEQAAGQRLLELVNQARATPRNCGARAFTAARPLRWNDTLAAASRLHAEDMARHNYFSHRGRDGSAPEQRVERAGYRYRATGENIAAGQMKPEEAVAGWIKSPPHCANLMSPAFAEMGAAYAVDSASDMGVYWAQEFGTPR